MLAAVVKMDRADGLKGNWRKMEFFFVWGHFLGLSFFLKFGTEMLAEQANGLPVSGARPPSSLLKDGGSSTS